MDEILDLLTRFTDLDDAEVERLNDLLSELDEVSDDDLAALEEALLAAYEAERDSDAPDLEVLTGLRDEIVSVREEAAEREAEAARREEELAELDASLEADDGDGDGDEPAVSDDDDEPTADDDGPEPDITPADDDDEPAAEEPDDEPQRQAAQTRRPRVSDVAARRPDDAAPRPTQRAGARLIAGGDLPGISAGTIVDDPERMGAAIAERLDHIFTTGARPGRFNFARIKVDYPDDRILSGDPRVDGKRVDAVVASAREEANRLVHPGQDDIEALTAAGGLCAPVDVSYDLFGVGNDRRPIRDSAAVRFSADRGGIRFITPPQLSDINVDTDGTYASDDDTAVALWTEATDTEPGSNVKPFQTITCGTEVEEVVDAITRYLQVGNFDQRTFAENFAAWWEEAGKAHARASETRLWDQMVTDSTAVTTGEGLGLTRDLFENLNQAAWQYRSRHRMDRDATLQVVLPDWTNDAIRADLLRQAPGDSTYAVTDGQIAQWFAALNLMVTYTPDTGQEATAQAAGHLNAYPDNIEALMYAPGSHLFLDGGTLDFGTEIRDTDLIATNDVQAFMETFEGHAFVGVESLHLTLDVCPSGDFNAGSTDFDPCATGS